MSEGGFFPAVMFGEGGEDTEKCECADDGDRFHGYDVFVISSMLNYFDRINRMICLG